MKRMIAASTIVVVVAVVTAFAPGSGIAASHAVPAGLVKAIHARLGPGLVRFAPHAAGKEPVAVFGYQVALSADGTTALVGAPAVNVDTGAAYIFHVSSAGSWTTTSTPTASLTDAKAGGYFVEFGVQVALSADGTTAFVGVPLSGEHGVVDVFHVSSEDAWASTSKPTATLTVGHGLLIGDVLASAPDGTTLLVGAPFYDFFAGGAYVFHVPSESSWVSTSTPNAVLTNINESDNDFFVGDAVAISGDGTTALVSDTGAAKGGAYVYHVASESAWTSSSSPTADLSAVGGAHDGLGYALALSGDGTTALLGAPGYNGSTGAVDVFHTSSADNWVSSSTPTAKLTKAGGATDDVLGEVVAMSASGTTAAATAIGAAGEAGASYVYHVADESSWATSSTPTATLTNSAGVAGDALGVGLALSGDGATALVGAPGATQEVGAADVFHVADESSWATTSSPTAILTDDALLHAGCIVPNLKGMYLPEARFVLKSLGCSVGEVDNAYAPFKIGRIIKQKPPAGTVLPLGSKINLVRSLGPWHKGIAG